MQNFAVNNHIKLELIRIHIKRIKINQYVEIATDEIDHKDYFHWMNPHETGDDDNAHDTVVEYLYAYDFDDRQLK